MGDCLFCKIVNKEASSEILYEDDNFIAIKDIHPKAPLHLLIIPKKHIPSVDHLETTDKELIGELFFIAQKIARDQEISKTGYKLVFNVGRGGGQMIDHLHLHLLGKWEGAEERDVPGMP